MIELASIIGISFLDIRREVLYILYGNPDIMAIQTESSILHNIIQNIIYEAYII